MSAPDQVPQGTNYSFTFQLDGENLTAFTYTLEAKQHPGDTAAFSRVVVPNSVGLISITVTPAETAALDIGLWYLIIQAVDSDEDIHSTRRIQITKAWA